MKGNTNAGTVKHPHLQPGWWDGVHPQQTHRSNQYSQHVEGNSFSPPCLWSLCAQFYIPQNRSEIKKQNLLSGGPLTWKGLEHLPSEARLRQLGLFNLVERWLQGGPSSSLPGPLRDCREDGASLFSELNSEGMRSNNTSFIKRNSDWVEKKYSLCRWLSNERGCLEKKSGFYRDTQN